MSLDGVTVVNIFDDSPWCNDGFVLDLGSVNCETEISIGSPPAHVVWSVLDFHVVLRCPIGSAGNVKFNFWLGEAAIADIGVAP